MQCLRISSRKVETPQEQPCSHSQFSPLSKRTCAFIVQTALHTLAQARGVPVVAQVNMPLAYTADFVSTSAQDLILPRMVRLKCGHTSCEVRLPSRSRPPPPFAYFVCR